MRFIFYASAVVISLDAIQLAEAGLFYYQGVIDTFLAGMFLLWPEFYE